jgi:hypothetical protein
MSMIAMWFKKSLIVAMIAATALGALPFVNAYAQSPTPVDNQALDGRLQKAWSREQTVYTRIGDLLNRANAMVSNIQTRLDTAKSNGKDVSSVQTALDAFSAAIKNVQAIYATLQPTIQAHAGFDASGNVTDPVQALQTVQDVRLKFLEIRQVGAREAGKALREAIQAFRQANRPATATPSATPNG